MILSYLLLYVYSLITVPTPFISQLTTRNCYTTSCHAGQHKTRQYNGEKLMQVLAPLCPYPCYTLN